MPGCTVRAVAARTGSRSQRRHRLRRSVTARSAVCRTCSLARRRAVGGVPEAGPVSGTRRHQDCPPTTYPQPATSPSRARMDQWRSSRRSSRSDPFPDASGLDSSLGDQGRRSNLCRSNSSTQTGPNSYPATCATPPSTNTAGRPPPAGPATTATRSLDAEPASDLPGGCWAPTRPRNPEQLTEGGPPAALPAARIRRPKVCSAQFDRSLRWMTCAKKCEHTQAHLGDASALTCTEPGEGIQTTERHFHRFVMSGRAYTASGGDASEVRRGCHLARTLPVRRWRARGV
jgi:hypothetical protein